MTTVDGIFLILYLIVELSNYLLGYCVLFRFHVKKKLGNWIAAAVLLLAIHFFVAFLTDVDYARVFSFFSMTTVPLLLLEENWKKGLGIYFMILISVMSIPATSTFLLTFMFEWNMTELLKNPSVELAVECIPISILLIVLGYRKFRHMEGEPPKLGRQQYILYNLGALSVSIMIASMQYFCTQDMNNKVSEIMGVVTMLSCMLFLGLLLWHGNAVSREIRLKDRIQTMEVYSKMEEEHFRQLLIQDERMRKFRHDFNAHAVALKGLSQNNQFEDLKVYIDKMVEASAYESVRRYTKDMGVDAVLGELIENAKAKDISISISGTLAEKNRVTSFELCSVFYNLVQNAIEACEKVEDGTPKEVKVTLTTFNERNVITVTNPVEKNVDLGKGLPRTTKKDSVEHGIGTMNLREIVNKYNGTINFTCENKIFRVEIVL